LRRSDIKLIPHPIRGQDFLAGPLLSFRHYYLKGETRGPSPDDLSTPNPLMRRRSPDRVSRKQYRATFVAQGLFCNYVT